MTQDEINFREWSNPDNWSGGWFRAYFSKQDTRVFVPKRSSSLGEGRPSEYPKFSLSGTTINFGNPRGLIWLHALYLLLLLPFVLIAIVCTQMH